MMRPALLQKYFQESWGLLTSCGLGLWLFGWMFVHIICQFDTQFLVSVLKRLPSVFEGLLPVPMEQLSSFTARLALVFDHPIVLLLIALWCISRSSDVVAGELDRGTLELLLAQPVRRAQLLWSSTAITLSGVALLAMLIWLGVMTGIQTTRVDRKGSAWQTLSRLPPAANGRPALARTPRRSRFGPSADGRATVPLSDLVKGRQFAPAVSNFFALGVFFCGLGTLLSSLNRYRWRTIGILAGFIVFQLMIDLLGKAAKPLEWIRWLTFFRAYDPAGFVVYGLHDPRHTWSWWQTTENGTGLGVLSGNFLLLASGVASLFAAQRVFQRRDLPAPL